ncbi:MAG TPA: NADH-quinone oxidoreductase subunit M [Gemmataceae bacterium]|jgi:NADH-quinone oxidoreductase subunit M|nr:NADH-quinone oxidoreductase subunit M [Gemmataceae bacterium]
MVDEIILRLLLLVPLCGAVCVAMLGPKRIPAIRWVSLAATLLNLVLAFIVAMHFIDIRDIANRKLLWTFEPEFTTVVDILPFGSTAVQFFIGVDGLNIWLIVLTALLMVPAVLVSWNSKNTLVRTNEFYAWLLALETAMIGVFLAFDIILFYVFFELTLVPLFFLIGIWGGPERRHAARKFFIYTFAGSMITFLGLLGVVAFCHFQANVLTFSIPQLIETANIKFREGDPMVLVVEYWVFLAMMVGFAIKVPLFPVHTWLPLAHVEAPTAGSVLLAGVLLKIGAYGFLRLCIPLAPDAALSVGAPLIGWLSVIGIIYGALCAMAQEDIKKLVAYSSVSHLGFCLLGMFALNVSGLTGSMMQMLNHGLSTGALFLLVGMLYDRYHTRQMDEYGGMAARLKLLSLFMVFVCMSSAGLPGLNGFVSEFLIFVGAFAHRPILAILASSGVVLGAWYLLRLLYRVFFGPLKEPVHEGHEPIHDLNAREIAALAPILILCIVLGVYPQIVMMSMERDINVVVRIAGAAKNRAAKTELAEKAAGQTLAAAATEEDMQ